MKKGGARVPGNKDEKTVDAYLAQCMMFRKKGRLSFRGEERRKKDRRHAIVYVEQDRRTRRERRGSQERRKIPNVYASDYVREREEVEKKRQKVSRRHSLGALLTKKISLLSSRKKPK